MAKYQPYIFGLLLFGLLAVAGCSTNGLTGYAPKNVGSCPKLSQASLDLDTAGCPTILGTTLCELRTSWLLEKSGGEPLVDPQDTPIQFTVKVTEGPTKRILVATGQIVITNSGQQTPFLSSVVVNLQDAAGKPFTVATAAAVKDAACKDGQGVEGAQTCFGQFTDSSSASLVLTDPSSNDVIALSDVPVPPSNCSNPVIINYEVEFDLDQAGLDVGDKARIEVLTTFEGAGARGKSPDTVSCTLDADCDGALDTDNPATCNVNEGETNNVRTVKQRQEFVVPQCADVCPSVTKTDDGAAAMNASCVQANTNALNDVINKQFEGAMTLEQIAGAASCVDGACFTDIVNTATLECVDGRDELIDGSPASASIPATCTGGGPGDEINVGDYCTFTQGGWGTACSGNNPGCFRNAYFSSVFPSGVGIGEGVACSLGVCGQSAILNGPSLFAAKWATSLAVENYLPKGGTPGTLTADLPTNPVSTSSGVLDAQLLAATLAIAYDDAGKFDADPIFSKNDPSQKLGDLVYQGGTPCDGLTVRQVLTQAHQFASGAGSSLSASQFNLCLSLLNEGFDACNVADTTHFGLP